MAFVETSRNLAMPIVTVFDDIGTVTDPWRTQPIEVFRRIKDGQERWKFEKLRDWEVDEEEKSRIKKSLKSICFSGDFRTRKDEDLLKHSGLIVLDIDGLKPNDLTYLKKWFEDWIYCYSVFVSPRGAGLKVVVKINDSAETHRLQFLSLKSYLDAEVLGQFVSTIKNERKLRDGSVKKIDEEQGDFLKVCIDPSGINVSRVCYESYDPDIHQNPEAEVWDELYEETESEKEPIKTSTGQPLDLPSQDIIDRLETWLQKREYYSSGNRNNYIYKLASAACRYGVDQSDFESYALQNYSDLNERELRTTIRSAYKSPKNVFNSAYFEKSEYQKKTKRKVQESDKGKESEEIEDDGKELGVFWGVSSKGIKILPDKLLNFLNAVGFYTYRRPGDVKDVLFVRVKNKIVEVVGIKDMKDAALSHVEQYNEINAESARDQILMNSRYFSDSFLNALPEIEIHDVRDSRNEIYMFFQDSEEKGYYYTVTRDGWSKKSLLEMDGMHIWKSHVSEREFTEEVSDWEKSDFCKFIRNASGTEEKFRSVCTSLGYLMHTYKKQSSAKLVYLYDEAMSELDGHANGGTGKNLVLKSLEYVRNVVNIDGKDFDKKNKHKFQSVKEDAQLVFIDDYEGDIKEMFAKITGTFTVNQMYKSEVQIPFEKSPKLAVSSNESPKGISSSYIRRLLSIEFSNYYNENRTPRDEFGRDFFSDEWKQSDWNALYTFFLNCAKLYLEKGLIEVKSENTKEKQLIRNTSLEFADWVENTEFDLTEVWIGREVFNLYKLEIDEKEAQSFRVRTFYTYIRMYCKIYGYVLKESKATGINKSFQIIKK